MTGYDVLKRAMSLLGYSNENGDPAGLNKMTARCNEIINQLSNDLRFKGINSLSEELKLNDKQADALCYGVAMLLSFIEGDSAKNSVLTDIYNAKRATALAEVNIIKDQLPATDMG